MSHEETLGRLQSIRDRYNSGLPSHETSYTYVELHRLHIEALSYAIRCVELMPEVVKAMESLISAAINSSCCSLTIDKTETTLAKVRELMEPTP